ncbi:response regulator transcription factor [Clostridium estertheticum]|uniref:LuxR C-terminal-related transcriptional regulator n=1 Tax=Clostridium estertheticum TaxID=238834 RepID=UPI0013E90E10|nr:response regulator transcription factor [Clostridium estertheticum]MBZ9689205.1 response regulator transcription factor [Clostridium estertheticum]
MKLVIVDDHPLVRKGIISILTNEKSIDEIKEASNIEEAMLILIKEEIEIAIVDLRLGSEDGLEIVLRGKKMNLKTKFVVLTSFIPQEDFKRAEKMDVDGYILKEAFAEDILYAIRLISRGKKYYDPEILKQKDVLNNSLIYQLTDRENDVLKEVGKGLSNGEIACALFISEHTVKKHVSNILYKLNLNHRSQVVFMVNTKVAM